VLDKRQLVVLAGAVLLQRLHADLHVFPS
jgi:hypothetical protein